jgi:hypothetical protein
MRYLYGFLILACLAIISGCSDKLTFEPEHHLVVVQAYLYAGKDVEDVVVTSTLGLGSTDTVPPPIADAQVQLVKNGLCYMLQPSWYKKGYYIYTGDCPECPVGELTVEEGDEFTLEVIYYGKVATATTVVPPPPAGVTITPESLLVSAATYPGTGEFSPGGFMAEDPNTALTVSWEDDGNSMYYVTLEHKYKLAEPIVPDYPFYYTPKFASVPFTGGNFSIGWINITHYGEYRLQVYKLNREYLEMYLSQSQDSRDLNEPLTNVDNGLGIFTALNSATIRFRVEEQ